MALGRLRKREDKLRAEEARAVLEQEVRDEVARDPHAWRESAFYARWV